MIYIGLKALNIFNILVREADINVLKKTSLIESSVEDEINQTYIEKLVKQVQNSQIVFYPNLIMNFYEKVNIKQLWSSYFHCNITFSWLALKNGAGAPVQFGNSSTNWGIGSLGPSKSQIDNLIQL